MAARFYDRRRQVVRIVILAGFSNGAKDQDDSSSTARAAIAGREGQTAA